MTSPILYLSDQDVRSLQLPASRARTAIAEAFEAFHHGTVLREPKTSIALGPGHAFQTLSAVHAGRGKAVVKWVGMVPPTSPGVLCVNASIQLSDVETGRLLCIMDAQHATALRTAAMSAQAAHLLALSDSRSVGFIGAGVQAAQHLTALADLLPQLRTVRVYSRTLASSQAFVARAMAMGMETAVVVTDPREAVSASDIVITSIPGRPGLQAFLDPRWLKPGAFVSAIDLGRPWMHAPIEEMDLVAVDDDPMKHYAQPGNLVPPLSNAHASLAELTAGHHPGRRDARERAMFFSSGSGIADLAIAMEIHALALERGVGTPLPH